MRACTRRQALWRIVSVAGVGVFGGAVASTVRAQKSEGRVIEVTARRFNFTPNQIRVKRGEVVTLALQTQDFPHGFNMPDFDQRVDLIPGKVVKVRLEPSRAGRFSFLCDNFCGDGHEQMGGVLIVED